MAGSDSEASINHGGLEKEDPDHYGRGVFTGRPEECAYEGLYRGPVKYLKSFFMAPGAHPDDVPAVFVVVHGFGCNVVGNHNTLRNVIKSKMVKSSVMIISPLFDKAPAQYKGGRGVRPNYSVANQVIRPVSFF